MTPDKKSVPAQDLEWFDLALLQSFVDLLRSQLAQLSDQLTDIQIEPIGRLMRHQRFWRSKGKLAGPIVPDDVAKDIDLVDRVTEVRAIAKKIDQDAAAILIESKRVWGTIEYITGNVHKVAFNAPPAPARIRSDAALGNEAQGLAKLTMQLVQESEKLQNALATLRLEPNRD